MMRIFRFNQKISIRFPILVSVSLLSIISIFILQYAGSHSSEIFSFTLTRVQKQFVWISMGSVVFIFIQFLRLRFFYEKINLFYVLMLILMCLPFTQPEIKGAKNWFMGFQPSEPSKIIVVMFLAKFLSDNYKKINNSYSVLISFIIILIPVSILVFQKDYGTAIIYLSILLPMLYWSGLNSFYIFLILSPAVSIYVNMVSNIYFAKNIESSFPSILLYLWIFFLCLIIVRLFSSKIKFNKYSYIFLIILVNISSVFISEKLWNFLEKSDHHIKDRLITYVVPTLDKKDGGWQVDQSLVAVGSGGLFGLGLGEGTQVKFKFLPEADTDFIISSIGEAFGFITILLIILVYLFLIYWLLDYAQKCKNRFFSLLIVGYLSIFLFHMLITLGMAVGLAPVTGLPAPFLSYGGTFTLSCFAMLGICNNISNNI